jgi:hypothetical protein
MLNRQEEIRLFANYVEQSNVAQARIVFSEAKSTDEKISMKGILLKALCLNGSLNHDMKKWAEAVIGSNQ